MRALVVAVIVVMAGCAEESDLGLPCSPNQACTEGYCAMDGLCTGPADLRAVTLTYTCTPTANCQAWPRFSTTASSGSCELHDCADLTYAPLECAAGATSGMAQVLQVPVRFETVQTMYVPAIGGAGIHDPRLVTTAQIVGDRADVAVHCEP